ncbi:MAG: iron ABC transporter permease [Armatimonadota bacterium]|nr:iron ABC transporter permease [Armatimonadota bacterium]MDR7438561.1 iron ABC transporter permease [Armatimonadota bacterium]MDR7562230.1 iron ABC transporter permease [Armatimonadota bacterium]MDR7567085.1 iron ABC transporter permease [Armatimonadota bacterium]MDR7602734.1 iron ABC transporter permease [Armatimonadota bacterium]
MQPRVYAREELAPGLAGPARAEGFAEALGRRAFESLVVLVAAWLLLVPLLTLVLSSLRVGSNVLPFERSARWGLENYWELLGGGPGYGRMLGNTLVYVAGTTAVALLVGGSAAWLVERSNVPGRRLFYALLVAPLMVPPVVQSISWILLFAPGTGLVNVLFRKLGFSGGVLNAFSLPGMVMAQGLGLVPLTFILISGALRGLDVRLEEAAWVSGATVPGALRRIVWPLLRPAIGAAGILSALIALESFEIPLLLGAPAGVRVYSSTLYFAVHSISALPEYGKVAALAVPGLALGFVALAGLRRWMGAGERYTTIGGKGFQGGGVALGSVGQGLGVAYLGTLSALLAIGPVVLLGIMSGFPEAFSSGFERLGGWNPGAWGQVLREETTWKALANSAVASGLGATLAMGLGVAVAWLDVRRGGRVWSGMDYLLLSSVTLPSVVLGLAAMLLYLWVGRGLYGTVWMLGLVYAARTGVVSRSARAAVMQVSRELEEAAWVCGASGAAVLRRVLFPVILPGILGGWLLHFVAHYRESTLALLLYQPESVVAGVRIWQLYDAGRMGEASALGLLVVLILVAAVYTAGRWGGSGWMGRTHRER